ncbi:MAG TPA: cytochrome c-type biogenesis CcmF C-terminal domain-containing protein [Terriglobales bacterium]|nr:cytochrome c-type biogenesis CcmF C-terminal domain-containing protein [Terriglobales bacterium]
MKQYNFIGFTNFMPYFGSFALLCALALSLYSLVVGAISLLRESPASQRLTETARRAGIATFIAVVAAAAALLWSTFHDDFSVAYILHHSNRDLPVPYKFAVLWSGQEGSLLFWSLLLGAYGFVLRLRHKVDIRLTAYASVILAGVQVFFLLLLNFAAKPFALTQGEIPLDGNGLNPLLQYPEMVIHPPMLYLGYVGMSVPFAFALGALIMRYPGEKWIHITRRWTMVTWMFLTCGIFLGSHWAYYVLGWGGYWGWDPVENASLLPWLTATAFLHSVMMQEKRGMMKVWNVWLIFATFMLSILGTFLTRSGVISSVHAFAQSSIGDWFLVFLVIILVVCLFFFVKNRSHLKSEHRLESLVSRESSFLFNNLLLLVSCFAVLWGTFFPILSEWVTGNKITVGPPFYNHVNVPIALLLLLLTATGPLLAWRRTSFASLQRNFTIPTVAAVATAGALMIGGMKPWQDVSYFYSLMAISLSVMVAVTIVSEFLRGARVISGHTGHNLFSSVLQLWRRNTRRYGGYIVHFGVAVAVIGLVGSAFNQTREQEMGNGDSLQIGKYTLVCRSYTQDDNANFGSASAIIDVFKNGRPLATMYPERRFFKASQQANTLPSVHSSLFEDLYLVYAGHNDTTDRPIITAHVNPLVGWFWTGWLILVLGTLLALVPNQAAAKVTQPVAVRATVSEASMAQTTGVGD